MFTHSVLEMKLANNCKLHFIKGIDAHSELWFPRPFQHNIEWSILWFIFSSINQGHLNIFSTHVLHMINYNMMIWPIMIEHTTDVIYWHWANNRWKEWFFFVSRVKVLCREKQVHLDNDNCIVCAIEVANSCIKNCDFIICIEFNNILTTRDNGELV